MNQTGWQVGQGDWSSWPSGSSWADVGQERSTSEEAWQASDVTHGEDMMKSYLTLEEVGLIDSAVVQVQSVPRLKPCAMDGGQPNSRICRAKDGHLHVPQGSAALRISDDQVVVLKARPCPDDIYVHEFWSGHGKLQLTSSAYLFCAEIKGTVRSSSGDSTLREFYIHDAGTSKVGPYLRALAVCAHFLESHSYEKLPVCIIDGGRIGAGLEPAPVLWSIHLTCKFSGSDLIAEMATPRTWWENCFEDAGVPAYAVQYIDDRPRPAGDDLFL